MIADFLSLRSRTEAIIILTVTIGVLSLDDSPSQISTNLRELWNFNFGDEIRKRNTERLLKSALAVVMLIRSYTSRIFLGLSMVVAWPVIFEKKQYLMVPWLTLGFIRSVLLACLGLVIGTYVCLVQKGYDAICLDFLLAQTIDHGPSIYAWISLYSYYRLLCHTRKVSRDNKTKHSYGKNPIKESTVTNLIINLKKPKPCDILTRSLDSLLSLTSSKIKEKDSEKSIPDFVKKILGIADRDIAKAKLEKSCRILPDLGSDIALAKSVSFSGRRKFEKPRQTTRVKRSEEFVNKEVELKCVSLEHSVHSRKDREIDDSASQRKEHSVDVDNGGKGNEENNFGCQVSTLSKRFFKPSPKKVTDFL